MPFEIPTLPALVARAQADLAGGSALVRSDAEVLARVLGAASSGRYGHQRYIADQILPDTADDETLLRIAQARLKRGRLEAVKASGTASFTGAVSALLDAGTLLQRDDQVMFRVRASVKLSSTEGVAQVEALEPGELGNTPAGTQLRLVSPVLGVNDTFTVAAPGLTGGTEQESIEALRARVRTVAAIIKRWAPEVENDTDAYIRTVAQRCGLAPSDLIKDIKNQQVLGGLVHAIIKHENANYEYSPAVFAEGLRRALA
ncbi:baseplate J/gp47 family protein [Pseudomonas sp. B21-044]|uniref:baseplate J/gp47 family protein n=1 Tax=Pseudomonas sp. B21-044 TaxID=2895488 RepID=UPI00215F0FF8|nr:baseplate J/gp47 family protein [Pseudomonas sp. B21-044]UVL17442.1 baseplate J/gp47 family protein [Pseudomonas sp. B21-044]